MTRLFSLICILMTVPLASHACGENTDCVVSTGTYRISLPQDQTAPLGAIVFAHGYQGSANGTMRNAGLIRMATERGLAFIAIDALDEDWDLPNAPGGPGVRDEMAYLDAVMADAAARFGIDAQRTVITGFSAGGMFVWNAICARGDSYGGYIPYSGTFWLAPPAGCAAGTPNIVHVHGDADRTVPLAGRAIAETRQGSVPETLRMYRSDKGFSGAELYANLDMSCERAVNAAGKRLDFCTFPGDHSFTAARLGAAYDALMQ